MIHDTDDDSRRQLPVLDTGLVHSLVTWHIPRTNYVMSLSVSGASRNSHPRIQQVVWLLRILLNLVYCFIGVHVSKTNLNTVDSVTFLPKSTKSLTQTTRSFSMYWNSVWSNSRKNSHSVILTRQILMFWEIEWVNQSHVSNRFDFWLDCELNKFGVSSSTPE